MIGAWYPHFTESQWQGVNIVQGFSDDFFQLCGITEVNIDPSRNFRSSWCGWGSRGCRNRCNGNWSSCWLSMATAVHGIINDMGSGGARLSLQCLQNIVMTL